jgi:hypothetical protein
MSRARIACLFALVALAGCAQGMPKDGFMRAEDRIRPYSGELRACNDEGVLGTIRNRFADRESSYWKSTLRIDGITHIRNAGTRPWGDEFIPRRFCTARAELNNGKHHTLHYSIAEDQSVIGYTYGVTWCVTGLDRNYQFAPGCRAAKP